MVGDLGEQAGGLRVGDQHLDRLDFTQRKRLGQHTARHEAGLFWKPRPIGQGKSQQRGVVGKKEDEKNGMHQDEQDQDRPQQQGDQQTRLRDQRHR